MGGFDANLEGTSHLLPVAASKIPETVVSLDWRNDVRWANLGHRRPDFQGFFHVVVIGSWYRYHVANRV
jgi:hypothetical protein